ncbi:hypothetical protein [Deinococcus yavapaiensis]|uniref:Uncharacterized protein n=1 Tax=Deinococcus yavapaiensis KR-236 TaxID=694435 RepID=A0A318SMX7_9DEIO|nr:hypothetical protein [Deinococcus yavapaiensis]PYE53911.1 hypothetical protein DES52_107169 [Deinococcus yavapaiensis KR-236]
MSAAPLSRWLTALLLSVWTGEAVAQQAPSEPASRSTLLGLPLSDAPRRLTSGAGYVAEIAQMNKGALSWTLGPCRRYELLYWTTALKVQPSVALAHFKAAVHAAGWKQTTVADFTPLGGLEAFVLSKDGRRVLASVVLGRGPSLSLCELPR